MNRFSYISLFGEAGSRYEVLHKKALFFKACVNKYFPDGIHTRPMHLDKLIEQILYLENSFLHVMENGTEEERLDAVDFYNGNLILKHLWKILYQLLKIESGNTSIYKNQRELNKLLARIKWLADIFYWKARWIKPPKRLRLSNERQIELNMTRAAALISSAPQN